MIELYYIEGISRNDTPFFNSQHEQEAYFGTKLITSIDNSYFPPHYTNKIKLTTDDLDIVSVRVNYVSLYYGKKYYYYFIDNIHYINEYVYELELTMDTIQTYLFNINIKKANVERRLINRYNSDDMFNRNYIRENLYNGIKKINRTILSDLTYWLVITSSNELGYATDLYGSLQKPLNIRTLSNMVNYSSGLYYYLYPLRSTKVQAIAFLSDTVTRQVNETYNSEMFNHLVQNANVLDIKIIDSYHLRDFYNPETNEYVFSEFQFSPYIRGDENTSLINITSDERLTKLLLINDIQFSKSTSIENKFNWKYIPFIWDDNYIEFNVGEAISKTSISLQLLNTDKFTFRTSYDLLSGARNYQLLINGEDIQETNLLVQTQEKLGLITDAWNEYYSRNKASATIGYATRLINNSISGYTAINTGDRNGINNAMSSILGDLLKYEDIKRTPDQIKQANEINIDIKSDNLLINYEWIMYSDSELDNIAKTIESNGYLVNEFYSNEVSIFTTLETRYYFNIIKCKEIDLSLTGVISDNTTISNIQDRFIKGFRYWSYSRLGNTMNMNELLKYDNVEIANV